MKFFYICCFWKKRGYHTFLFNKRFILNFILNVAFEKGQFSVNKIAVQSEFSYCVLSTIVIMDLDISLFIFIV